MTSSEMKETTLAECGHFAYRQYHNAADDYGCAGCDNDMPSDSSGIGIQHSILFCFQSNMHSVFVYSHDGPHPVLRDYDGENAEVAFPLNNLEFSEIDVDKLCEFIRAQYDEHSRSTTASRRGCNRGA